MRRSIQTSYSMTQYPISQKITEKRWRIGQRSVLKLLEQHRRTMGRSKPLSHVFSGAAHRWPGPEGYQNQQSRLVMPRNFIYTALSRGMRRRAAQFAALSVSYFPLRIS
jgi:hypothetical protein